MTNAWDWLKAKLEGEPAPEGTTTSSTATLSAPVTESAEFKALKARTDAVEADNRRIRLERIHDQAATFADTQIREHRAFPAEREAIITDYIQRASDDLVLEPQTVTFKDKDGKDQTKKVTRVELLQASFAVRPQHGLTKEQLEAEGLAVLMNRSETDHSGSNKPADDKRVKELAEMTPLGRASFAKKNGTN